MEKFNYKFYKKMYPDVKNYNELQLIQHWSEIGIKKKRLPNEMTFYKKFQTFDWEKYAKNYPFLNDKYETINYYWHFGQYDKGLPIEMIDKPIINPNNVVNIYNNNILNLINILSINSFLKNGFCVNFYSNIDIKNVNNISQKLTNIIDQLELLRIHNILINNNLILCNSIPDDDMIIIHDNQIIFAKNTDKNKLEIIIDKFKNDKTFNCQHLNSKNKYIKLVSMNNCKDFFYTTEEFSHTNFLFIDTHNIKYSLNYPIIKTPFFELFKNNFINKTKILLTSTQYVGYGGAATNIYNLHNYLQQIGYDVCSIFFHNSLDVDYNPLNLKNVYLENIYKIDTRYDEIRNKITTNFGYPKLILAKNYVAPYLTRYIFPDSYIIYLVSGIVHHAMKEYELMTFDELIKIAKSFKIHDQESLSVNLSNLIITNSTLTQNLFTEIYGPNKIYHVPINTTEIITLDIINNIDYDKQYDIVICVSNLERKCKNISFLDPIMVKLKNYKKCVIGLNYDKYSHWENTTFMGLISNDLVIETLKKCKLMILPTLFESNSNCVMEAIQNKCLVLVSNYLGNYDRLPEQFVIDNFDENQWYDKIIYLVENYKLFNKLIVNFSYDDGILDIIEKYS